MVCVGVVRVGVRVVPVLQVVQVCGACTQTCGACVASDAGGASRTCSCVSVVHVVRVVRLCVCGACSCTAGGKRALVRVHVRTWENHGILKAVAVVYTQVPAFEIDHKNATVRTKCCMCMIADDSVFLSLTSKSRRAPSCTLTHRVVFTQSYKRTDRTNKTHRSNRTDRSN